MGEEKLVRILAGWFQFEILFKGGKIGCPQKSSQRDRVMVGGNGGMVGQEESEGHKNQLLRMPCDERLNNESVKRS